MSSCTIGCYSSRGQTEKNTQHKRRRQHTQKIRKIDFFFGVFSSFFIVISCSGNRCALIFFFSLFCVCVGKFLCNGLVGWRCFPHFLTILTIHTVIADVDYMFRVQCKNWTLPNVYKKKKTRFDFLSLLAVHESCTLKCSSARQCHHEHKSTGIA